MISIIDKLIAQAASRSERVVILCERIRTLSRGKGGKQGFGLKPDYLKSTGALIACIVDIAYKYGVKVYSVDTRSWKSKVVGTSKGIDGDNKLPTIRYVCKLGFSDIIVLGENRNGKMKYNDDAADSACIALYAFVPAKDRKLELED